MNHRILIKRFSPFSLFLSISLLCISFSLSLFPFKVMKWLWINFPDSKIGPICSKNRRGRRDREEEKEKKERKKNRKKVLIKYLVNCSSYLSCLIIFLSLSSFFSRSFFLSLFFFLFSLTLLPCVIFPRFSPFFLSKWWKLPFRATLLPCPPSYLISFSFSLPLSFSFISFFFLFLFLLERRKLFLNHLPNEHSFHFLTFLFS